MAQTKKEDIRAGIVDSARREFEERGYAATTIRGIARRAGISPSNVYVYFDSKLEILFAIYDPWLRGRIRALEAEAAAIADPRQRLRTVIATLWKTFPAADGAFGNTFVEGLAVSGREGRYSRDLLLWAEHRIADLILSLPAGRPGPATAGYGARPYPVHGVRRLCRELCPGRAVAPARTLPRPDGRPDHGRIARPASRRRRTGGPLSGPQPRRECRSNSADRRPPFRRGPQRRPRARTRR